MTLSSKLGLSLMVLALTTTGALAASDCCVRGTRSNSSEKTAAGGTPSTAERPNHPIIHRCWVSQLQHKADPDAPACDKGRGGSVSMQQGRVQSTNAVLGCHDAPPWPAKSICYESLAATCRDRPTGGAVKLGGLDLKCPAGLITSDPRMASHVRPRGQLGQVSCNPSSSWPGWSRCCNMVHTYCCGWQIDGCWWTQSS